MADALHSQAAKGGGEDWRQGSAGVEVCPVQCHPACPVEDIVTHDEIPPHPSEFIDMNQYIFADALAAA